MQRAARFRAVALAVIALTAGLGVFASVSAQRTIVDVYAGPISIFDAGVYATAHGAALAAALPSDLQRPIDDLTPRPGAAAMGMGGANVALAEGAAAMGWNPAGLGALRETSVFADGYVRSSSGSGSRLPDSMLVEGVNNFRIRSYRADLGSHKAFGFWGAATPLMRIGSRPLVGGVAYRQCADIVYGQQTLLTMGLFSGSGTGFPFVLGVDNTEKGSLESLTIGLAYQPIASRTFSLSAGATANFVTGRLRSDVLLRAAVRSFGEGQVSFQQNYKGFAIEAGLLASVMEKVRCGLWLGLPHDLECTNGRITSSPLILPDAMEIERVHWEIAGYDMGLPLFLSAGIALGPVEGIEVAMDVNQRPWSDVTVTHHAAGFTRFDSSADLPYPAADVMSYNIGGRFQFPFFRQSFDRRGMKLNMQIGYRTLPLSMRSIDPAGASTGAGRAPAYGGDPVEGSASGFGFSLETRANVTLQFGVEMQSYEYETWFLGDARSANGRELNLPVSNSPVMTVTRDNTVLRFSSEMRF
jgi:hypothetical protein